MDTSSCNGESTRSPEPPGLHFLPDLAELPSGFPVIPGEIEIVLPEFALLIGAGQGPVPLRQPDAFAMHGEETVEKGECRKPAVVSLEPEFIRAERTDRGRVAELDVGLPGKPDAQKESCELFVGAALG